MIYIIIPTYNEKSNIIKLLEQIFGLLVNRVSQYKPSLFKGNSLIILNVIYLLSLIIFIYRLIKL